MKKQFPESKADLFAAFIERVETMVRRHGFMAQVTMQSWMFLSSYEKLRKRLQRDASIVAMLHMGNMVMRIAFGTSATVWEIGGDPQRPGKYTYVEASDLTAGVPRVFPATNDRTANAEKDGLFIVSQAELAVIPRAPVAYWLTEKMRASFLRFGRLVDVADSRQGLATADDSRFLRRWWEVSFASFAQKSNRAGDLKAGRHRWFSFTKGGEFRKWYGNNEYVINWWLDGKELYDFRPRSVIRNAGEYFRPAVTYGLITSGAPSFRLIPEGSVFGHKGPVILARDSWALESIAGYMNSAAASQFFDILSPTIGLEIGQISSLPVGPSKTSTQTVAKLVRVAKLDWDSSELSCDFTQTPLRTTKC